MHQVGEEVMSWDEDTKKAVFFYQGHICLERTCRDFNEAKQLANCLGDIYKHGVKDGITAAQCAIDSITTD